MSYGWKAFGGSKITGKRKVLLDAADYIRTHGWNKGRLKNKDGEVCALGGILAASGRSMNYFHFFGLFSMWGSPSRATKHLRKYLMAHERDCQLRFPESLWGSVSTIYTWNDTAWCKEDVINTLEQAAFWGLK